MIIGSVDKTAETQGILLLTESFPPITIFLNLDKKSKERL